MPNDNSPTGEEIGPAPKNYYWFAVRESWTNSSRTLTVLSRQMLNIGLTSVSHK